MSLPRAFDEPTASATAPLIMDRVAQTRLIWLLGVFALVLLLYAGIILEVYPQHRGRLPSVAVALLGCAATAVPLRQGRGAAAMWTASIAAFVYIATAMVSGGGLAAPIAIAVPLAVVLPGWLLGRRAGRLFAALVSLLCLCLLAAELAGWLPQPTPLPVPLRFVVVIGAIAAAFALTDFAARAQRQHVRQMRRLAEELGAAHADTAVRMNEFRTLADNLPGLVMRFDLDLKCLFANQSFLLATGGDASTLIGHPLDAVFNVRDANALHAAMRRAAQGERASVLLPDFRDREGAHLLEFVVVLERDAAGAALGYLALAYDVTERERAQIELRRAVCVDPLTGLVNAVALEDRLNHALVRAGRDGRGLAVIALDLDGFARINDLHGRATGDALLVHVANQLHATAEIGDSVARIGGDRFVVIGEAIDNAEQALAFAERLLAAARQPCCFDGRTVALGASLGVAVYPHHGTRGTELLTIAESAMFGAKREGGLRVHLAHGDFP